jgi:precorrin-6B methylase 2
VALQPGDATDPDQVGASLRNLASVILPCLEAIGARSVLEVGASHGDFTVELLGWAKRQSARVVAVEPTPPPELLAVAERHPELELVRETSHDALSSAPRTDAIVIDGDHNYYTVSEDLRLIAERHGGLDMPLILLHDLGWPHGRRDAYYAPERIPEHSRQRLAHNAFLDPAEPGVADGGILVEWAAEREGGPRNGVRTAVEEFVAAREGIRVALVPAFFGLGVVWDRQAPWSDAVAGIVEPLDRDPLLERLEENRILKQVQWARCVRGRNAQEQRMRAQAELLRGLSDSAAFAWVERLSRLGGRRRSAVSRHRIRRLLEQSEGEGPEDG